MRLFSSFLGGRIKQRGYYIPILGRENESLVITRYRDIEAIMLTLVDKYIGAVPGIMSEGNVLPNWVGKITNDIKK